eukprot:scaffold8272_cov77-Phaeocystis_antarctica.AAC.2
MAFSGRPSPFSMRKTMRARCTDPAPSISVAGRSGTKTQCRMEGAHKDAQRASQRARGACLTNTSQSRMPCLAVAWHYRCTMA